MVSRLDAKQFVSKHEQYSEMLSKREKIYQSFNLVAICFSVVVRSNLTRA